MERFISANLLKETIRNPPVHCSLGGITIQDVLTMIDEQPTAYDIEKVVEELEEETEVFTSSETMHIKYAIPKYKAIDIVRKGGVKRTQ